jgi:prevent-host-death family protein
VTIRAIGVYFGYSASLHLGAFALNRLAGWRNMCKYLPMSTISVPIGEGRTDLCQLVKKAESGVQVILTSHGKPKAVLSAYRQSGPPWRAEIPDDPRRYGDLQAPVMEDK